MANDTSSIRNANVSRTNVANQAAANKVGCGNITEGLKNGVGMNGQPANAAVNTLQQALNEQTGAGLKVDGRFGPKTEAAVIAFQEKNGIAPTGTICNQTLAKLQGRTAEPTTTTGSTSATKNQGSTKATAAESPPQASPAGVEQSRSKMKSREELMRARVAAAERAETDGQDYDTITDKSVQSALEGVQQIRGSLDEQRRAVGQARVGLQNDIRALAGKKGRTEAEEMLLTGKRQQDEVLGQLEKHIDTKKTIVNAAGDAVSDGVITASEDEGIATASEISQRMERMLASKAKAADAIVASAESLGARVPERVTNPTNDSTTTNTPPPPTTQTRRR